MDLPKLENQAEPNFFKTFLLKSRTSNRDSTRPGRKCRLKSKAQAGARRSVSRVTMDRASTSQTQGKGSPSFYPGDTCKGQQRKPSHWISAFWLVRRPSSINVCPARPNRQAPPGRSAAAVLSKDSLWHKWGKATPNIHLKEVTQIYKYIYIYIYIYMCGLRASQAVSPTAVQNPGAPELTL